MNEENQTAPTPEQQAETQKEVNARAVALKMDEHGVVKIENLADELAVCSTLVKAGMLPEALKTGQQVFAARQLCRELGLPPMSAIRQVCVVNGVPAIWGDLPLALVRRSGQLEYFREYLVDAEYKEISVANKNLTAAPLAAVCEVQRKGYEKKTFYFTVEQAKAAGLLQKKIWALYQQRMLGMRVRGLALKNEFSDVLMGVGIAEYDFDQMPGSGIRDVNDHTETQNLNNFFKGEGNAADRKSPTATI